MTKILRLQLTLLFLSMISFFVAFLATFELIFYFHYDMSQHFAILVLIAGAILLCVIIALLLVMRAHRLKLVEVIEKRAVVDDISYPGYILTSLSDVEFLRAILIGWAKYSEEEIEVQLADADEMVELTDKVLRTEGFLVSVNNDPDTEICLIKIGKGKWVVDGMTIEEMKDFVV